MIYGYICVCSDKQTVENQRFEINNFCKRKGIGVDDWIEETISGTKAYSKRKLGDLLKHVHKDDPKGAGQPPRNINFMARQNLSGGLLKEGVSQRKIARICKVDRNTLNRYIRDVIKPRETQ